MSDTINPLSGTPPRRTGIFDRRGSRQRRVLAVSTIVLALIVTIGLMVVGRDGNLGGTTTVSASAEDRADWVQLSVQSNRTSELDFAATVSADARFGSEITVTVAEVGRPRVTPVHLLRGAANTYRGTVSVTGSAPVTIAFPRSKPSTLSRLAFFYYADNGTPVLTPVLTRAATALPYSALVSLGNTPIWIRATPTASGAFRLAVGATSSAHSRHLPDQLSVALSMYEMDMGVRTLSFHAANKSSGQGSVMTRFSMAGPWGVTVSDAGHTVSVALLVPPANSTSSSGGTVGYAGPILHTHLPYTGFVTAMRGGRLVELNGRSTTQVGRTPHGVDFVPHKPLAYVSDMSGNTVHVIDERSGRAVAIIPTGIAPAHIVFSPDGTRAFVTDFLSADVTVINVTSHKSIATIPVGLNPHGIDIDDGGKFVYVACAHGGGIWVINAHTDKVAATIPTGIEPYGVVIGPPDSGVIYVTDYELNQVDVVSLAHRKVVKRISVGGNPALLVASPAHGSDPNRLYVSDHGSGEVSVINMRSNTVVATVKVGSGPHGLDITPDGRYVYVANNNSNTVSIINTNSDRMIETLKVPGEPNEVALTQSDDVRP
jgi:YVTN family beta-propeller protein